MIKLSFKQQIFILFVLAFLFLGECFYIYKLLVESPVFLSHVVEGEILSDLEYDREVRKLKARQTTVAILNFSILPLSVLITSGLVLIPFAATATIISMAYVTNVANKFSPDTKAILGIEIPMKPEAATLASPDVSQAWLDFLAVNSSFLICTITTALVFIFVFLYRSEQ